MISVGVDEAGRGCFFSRVYAAAVVWPTNGPSEPYPVTDSKKITKRRRGILFDFIKKHAVAYGIGYATEEEIDEYNILNATMMAMHRALDQIDKFDQIYVDGNRFKPYFRDGKQIRHECVIEGDALFKCISAASILAKESRDRYVVSLCDQYPVLDKYGFRSNMGYGSKKHRDAIAEYGITPFHRKSYAPCQGKPVITLEKKMNIESEYESNSEKENVF